MKSKMLRKKISWFLGLAVGVGLAYYGYSRLIKTADRSLPADFSQVLIPQTEQLVKEGQQGLREKQYAPVIETLKRMRTRYPDNPDLKKKLAFAYFASGRYPEAEPLLKEVQKGDPDPEISAKLAIIAGERER